MRRWIGLILLVGLLLSACAMEAPVAIAPLPSATPLVDSLPPAQVVKPIQPDGDPVLPPVSAAEQTKAAAPQLPLPALPNCSVDVDPDAAAEMVGLINQARGEAGLPALEVDGRLAGTALAHSQDMACSGFADHVGSDGRTVFERITDSGYAYLWAGENIYGGGPSVQGAFDAWMSSAGHRENILKPEFKHIGVGVLSAAGSQYNTYFTADFGSTQ